MKTTRPNHPTPRRRPQPTPTRQPDSLPRETIARQLHTDFLALCLYPGMSPLQPTGPEPRAA